VLLAPPGTGDLVDVSQPFDPLLCLSYTRTNSAATDQTLKHERLLRGNEQGHGQPIPGSTKLIAEMVLSALTA
jgi:hypothetical protein